MKLVSYSTKKDDLIRLGLVLSGKIIDVEYGLRKVSDNKELSEFPGGLIDLLQEWDRNKKLIKKLENESEKILKSHEDQLVIDESEIQFHSLLPVPNSFRDFYAFEQHVRNARKLRNMEIAKEWYDFPAFYFSNHNAFKGTNAEITKPKYTNEMDFELEISCIIGKTGKNIKLEDAKDYITGFSILNDWSARDIQREEMKVGLGPAKGKDFATSMGPFLVTPEEISEFKKNKGFDLKMTARKNGEIISEGNWADIHYSFEEMIVRASDEVTLYPGDVIGSGTVGTGCILELRPENTNGWLEPGDEIELEVEKLGKLKNTIV